MTTYGILKPKVSTYKANDIYWSYVRRVTGTQLEQDNAIATLMAHLGYQLKSRYKLVYRDSDSTWVRKTSTPMTEVENCFSSCYNIDCNYVNWDTDTVIEQLDNEMPVIVAVSSSSGSGHCWIVDGYYVAPHTIRKPLSELVKGDLWCILNSSFDLYYGDNKPVYEQIHTITMTLTTDDGVVTVTETLDFAEE